MGHSNDDTSVIDERKSITVNKLCHNTTENLIKMTNRKIFAGHNMFRSDDDKFKGR